MTTGATQEKYVWKSNLSLAWALPKSAHKHRVPWRDMAAVVASVVAVAAAARAASARSCEQRQLKSA